MTIDGKPHPHSFFRDGEEKRVVEADITRGKGIEIRSAIQGLLVLKSTGSQFHSFVHDDFTTLPDVTDRILSTSVDAGWKWKTFSGLDQVKSEVSKFDDTWTKARDITMKTFAEEDSPSVQNTMYLMCEKILAAAPSVEAVDYALPNKHYFEIGEPSHKIIPMTPADMTSRPELASWSQKYRKGRGGLRSTIRPQWFDQMHCFPIDSLQGVPS